ncbi:MAG TPA: ABC transporter permease [Thermoanaerobaculia bacterium]|nr:ABC transporter permease [Thermoanaerobaculia bacterium]
MRGGSLALRAGAALLAALAAVALLSPLIATDLPLAVRGATGWRFPAFANWLPALLDAPAPAESAAEGERVVSAPVPYSPRNISLAERLEPPSRRHRLGTDELGRDVLARVIHGARISLVVGFCSALFALLIGCALGGCAGYFGGWIDGAVMRLVDAIIAFPFMILLLTIVAILEPGMATIVLALALTSWTAEARLVRGEVLRVRETEYATAAKAVGAGKGRIVVRHLIPNALAPAIVTTTFGVSGAILAESAISFLGFGISSPRASWGTILSSADDYLLQAWWLTAFPGIAIFLTVIACNLLGEGLRDALDPAGSQR